MVEFLHTPFFWLFLGIFFMLIELTHYGFIFFFFGIGAFWTAIFTWVGVTDTLIPQMLLFIFSSLFFLFLLRKKMSNVFKGKISGKNELSDDINGKRAVVVSAIYPDKMGGKVEFHGTLWEAQSEVEIEKDAIVEIIDRVNLTLKVRKIEKS